MKRSRPLLPVVVATDPKIEGPWLYETGKRQRVILRPAAILTMGKYRQLKSDDAEAGGMLFARISPDDISIEEASEPQRVDRRSRFSFWPCTPTQQRLINSRFKEGLHFVGEWHTHPEAHPHPSDLDLASMGKCFRESRHELMALIMIILGTDVSQEGLWVSSHDRRGYRRLLRTE